MQRPPIKLIAKPALKRVSKPIVIRVSPATKQATPQPQPVQQPSIRIIVPQPHRASPVVKTTKHNIIPAKQPPQRQSNIIQHAPITSVEIHRIQQLQHKGQGRSLVILGNGPSLAEIDVSQLQSLHKTDTMAINHADDRVWPTTYWAFCDISQYRRHADRMRSYAGTLINSTSVPPHGQTQVRIKNRVGYGFSEDLTQGYHIGRSTVYAAMQVAHWMAYERVYILGIDMNPAGHEGKFWYYGQNPDVKPAQRGQRFQEEANNYQWAADHLDPQVRAKYWFCSAYNPWQFVKSFNHLDHRVSIQHILQFDKEL